MALPESPTTSPAFLGLLTQGGNEAAWQRFMLLYTPLVDDWARRAGLRGADIDEVRSHVWAGLVSAFKDFRYDPARKFRGYLCTAVNNAASTYFRQRTTRPGTIGTGGEDSRTLENLPAPDLGATLDESMTADLRRIERVISRVRDLVKEHTWRAFWLTAIEGKTAAEAGAELQMTTAAVYMAKSRVGKLLLAEGKKLLGEGHPE